MRHNRDRSQGDRQAKKLDPTVLKRLAEVLKKVENGELNEEQLKAIVDGQDPFTVKKGKANLQFAIQTLGADKVIIALQSTQCWGVPRPQPVTLNYYKKTIEKCKEENEKQGEDWRLIYINGFSLRQQGLKRGIGERGAPCFSQETWWFEEKEDFWAEETFAPGYYLINLKGQFASLKWEDQARKIEVLGNQFKRCPEAIFAEAIFTVFMVNNGEQLAKDWWHWGLAKDWSHRRVNIGRHNDKGLNVDATLPNSKVKNLKTVILRKWD